MVLLLLHQLMFSSVADSFGAELLTWLDLPITGDAPLACDPLSTYLQVPEDLADSMPQPWMHQWPTTTPTWQHELQPNSNAVPADDSINPLQFFASSQPSDTPSSPSTHGPSPTLAEAPPHNHAVAPSAEARPVGARAPHKHAHAPQKHARAPHKHVHAPHKNARAPHKDDRSVGSSPTVPIAFSVRQAHHAAASQRTQRHHALTLTVPYPSPLIPRRGIITIEKPFVCLIQIPSDCACARWIEPTCEDIRHHFKVVHKLRGPMKCPWPAELCPEEEKEVLGERALYQHIFRKHSHSYGYHCVHCDKELPDGTELGEAESHAMHCQQTRR